MELNHGQLEAPQDEMSTSSSDELAFARSTVASMIEPVMLAETARTAH